MGSGQVRTATACAAFDGTAPIEVSPGDVVRQRLRRRDRQLNSCLHIMAITQIRHDTPGHAYYQRKRAAGKSHREALRCLKRQLSDAVYPRTRRHQIYLAQAALIRQSLGDTPTPPFRGGNGGVGVSWWVAGVWVRCPGGRG